MTRLLIAASGTGGHLFPAIAVADALPKSWDVTWLGVADRLEIDLVPKKYQLKTISVEAVQTRGLKRIYQIFRLFIATARVIRLIKRQRIQVVFTTGGYISVPTVLAAKLSGIKVILHESNAIPGKATRLLGRFCDHVALGCPPATKYLSACNLSVTGTPVRKPFLQKQPLPDWVPSQHGPLVLVVGGSQGAVGLNVMFRDVLPDLLKKDCRIVHITGKNDISNFAHENFVQKPFTNQLAGLLQHADLVISRAGAGALSEFAVCGTPAILVPYPYAAELHQEFNAVYAAQFGAAIIVHQHAAGEKILGNVLDRLLSNQSINDYSSKTSLQLMKDGMEKIAVRDAQEKVVELLSQFS